MIHGLLMSALRLPLLFRGDVMRQSSLAVLALTTPPLVLLLAIKVRAGMRASVAALWALLSMYLSWAAGLLFEPTARIADPYLVENVGHWINLVPFATIAAQVRTGSGSAVVQLVGNCFLLLPVGLLGPVLMRPFRRASFVALVALGASIAIEFAQLAGTRFGFINRSVDVDDVILNVAGALLGWALWRAVASLSVRGRYTPKLEESSS